MKKQILDKISNDIYSYLKDWLNPQGIMVPGYVYMEIRNIIKNVEKIRKIEKQKSSVSSKKSNKRFSNTRLG